MGLSHSPRIVTDNLVLALDAGSPKSVAPAGQQTYTSSGTYNWTCPAGVTSVSVVCIGGGGGGGGRGDHVTNGSSGQGGYGGGLGYKNNISVTPGQSYTVVIGGGGSGASNTTDGYAGGDSYFIDATTVKGGGGPGGLNGSDSSVGSYQTAAGYVGDGGGNGGRGGRGNQTNSSPANPSGGGGGAGGYSGNGGDGGDAISSTYNPGAAGSGGSGGGGSSAGRSGSGHRIGAGGGGGVGLLGEGSSGGATSTPTVGSGTYGGKGGSGGSDAADNPWVTGDGYLSGSHGASYGGGGGGHGMAYGARSGAGGAVRIMWGSGRSYPSTNTTDQSSSTWTDLSGKGSNGTISGATHTSGVGGYFEFDGSNGYVSYSNDSFVSNGGATLECWFNADTGSVLRSLINHSGYTYYNLMRSSDNKIRLEYKSTSQNNTQLLSSSTISTGIWYHVVGVVDNTGARIYINGELDASNSTPQNLGTVSSTLYIGGYSSSSTYRFDGKIAVAKRYDKPLTASEIQQNFNALRRRYGI